MSPRVGVGLGAGVGVRVGVPEVLGVDVARLHADRNWFPELKP